MNTKCTAFTAQGKQCSKNAKPGQPYCGVHVAVAAKQTKLADVKDVEPWTLKGLPVPDERNPKRLVQKIRTLLHKGPKKDDGAGYIYVYYLKSDQKNTTKDSPSNNSKNNPTSDLVKNSINYWKIGRTKRSVDKRMEEWSEVHGEPVQLECFYQLSANHEFVERLIHLYLSYCRMGRIPYEDGGNICNCFLKCPRGCSLECTLIFCFSLTHLGKKKMHSTWEYLGDVIDDGQQTSDLKLLVAKNKHTEWFCDSFRTIVEAVIDPIILLYGQKTIK